MSAVTKVTAESGATLEVGDFLVSSWGYDQTNVDFYKVVGFTPSGKSVKVQKWNSAEAEGWGAVTAGGGPRTYTDWSGVDQNADYWTQQEQKVVKEVEVMTKRLNVGGYFDFSISLTSYSSAHKWSGAVEYQTPAGFGH